jgi:hypothetical protein
MYKKNCHWKRLKRNPNNTTLHYITGSNYKAYANPYLLGASDIYFKNMESVSKDGGNY